MQGGADTGDIWRDSPPHTAGRPLRPPPLSPQPRVPADYPRRRPTNLDAVRPGSAHRWPPDRHFQRISGRHIAVSRRLWKIASGKPSSSYSSRLDPGLAPSSMSAWTNQLRRHDSLMPRLDAISGSGARAAGPTPRHVAGTSVGEVQAPAVATPSRSRTGTSRVDVRCAVRPAAAARSRGGQRSIGGGEPVPYVIFGLAGGLGRIENRCPDAETGRFNTRARPGYPCHLVTRQDCSRTSERGV
jgi:hypothetical protein